MKIAINRCYGGFGLSDEAFELYLKKKGITYGEKVKKFSVSNYYTTSKAHYAELCKESINKCGNYSLVNKSGEYISHDIERNDPILIEVIEELGVNANSRYSNIKIVEIPDGTDWKIDEYDGMERVDEKHRSWC